MILRDIMQLLRMFPDVCCVSDVKILNPDKSGSQIWRCCSELIVAKNKSLFGDNCVRAKTLLLYDVSLRDDCRVRSHDLVQPDVGYVRLIVI